MNNRVTSVRSEGSVRASITRQSPKMDEALKRQFRYLLAIHEHDCDLNQLAIAKYIQGKKKIDKTKVW